MDRIIINTDEVNEFLEDIMRQEDVEPGRNLIEEIWIKKVLKKYIKNEYPNVKATKYENSFKVILTKKFKDQICNILDYFDFLSVKYKGDSRKRILNLSFDIALKKAEDWKIIEKEKAFTLNSEKKELLKIKKKELLSLKELEQTFNSLNGEKEDKRVLINWSEQLWYALNKKLFKDKLELPLIVIKENISSKGWLAQYRYSPSTLYFLPKLFNSPFHRIEKIMTHEMCHQAVDQISKVTNSTDPRFGLEVGGHGSEWVKWMKECKLNPDILDDALFHDTYDYRDFEILNRNLEQEAVNRGKKKLNVQPKKYDLVKLIYDGKWKIGMIVGNYTHKKGEVCTVVFKSGEKYSRINENYNEMWKVSLMELNESNVDIEAMKKVVDDFLEKV